MKKLNLKNHSSFAGRVAFAFTLTFALSFSESTLASPVFKVYVRNTKRELVLESKELKSLKSDQAFMGRHFVIVNGMTDEPISFQAAPEVVTHAASVYYHLETARDFLNTQTEKNKTLRGLADTIHYPVTIRIEMTQPFSTGNHFVTNGTTAYNTSLTIPASDDNRHDSVPEWGNEIWFYKSKDEKHSSPANQVTRVLNQRAYKNLIFQQLTYPELTKIGLEYSYGITPFWPGHLVSLGTSLLVTELFVPFLELATKPFKSTSHVDTALIPEAVYHEFAHLIFQERLDLFRPTALVEGYPNYFASQVSGLSNLADKAGSFMKGIATKNGKSKETYTLQHEYTLAAATGSFVFSLLYQLKKEFGELEGDDIIYGALQYLDRSSDIRIDFERAVLKSILEQSRSPLAQILRAQKVFQQKGL